MFSTVNVCILAPFRVIPPVSGSARRVFEISMGLCDAGVTVVLLHAGSSRAIQHGPRVIGFPAPQNFPMIAGFKWSSAMGTYLSSGNFALYHSLARVLVRLKVDILQVEGPWSIAPAELVRAITYKVPLIYDAHNIESMSVRYSSSAPWLWPYATFIERKAARRSAAVFCVSELDKTRMCTLYRVPSKKVVVIPNGVRSSLYRTDQGKRIRRRHSLGDESKIIFFQGELGWKPNADAADTIVESIAPRVETEKPEMIFLIAGPHTPQRLFQSADGKRNVRILGFVPNIAEYISAADVCIAPMKIGSGTKLKILEYLAAGKPVVATRKAIEGIGIRHGKEALLTDDTDEEFIRAIKAAATPELSRNLGREGRAFAAQFEWSAIARKAAQAYEAVLDQTRQLGA